MDVVLVFFGSKDCDQVVIQIDVVSDDFVSPFDTEKLFLCLLPSWLGLHHGVFVITFFACPTCIPCVLCVILDLGYMILLSHPHIQQRGRPSGSGKKSAVGFSLDWIQNSSIDSLQLSGNRECSFSHLSWPGRIYITGRIYISGTVSVVFWRVSFAVDCNNCFYFKKVSVVVMYS